MSAHHVVVGAGPVGTRVALRLADAGDSVTVVTRSGSGPNHPRITLTSADSSTAEGAATLAHMVQGAESLVNAVNPKYHQWGTQWPIIHRAMLDAAAQSGARLVTVSNLYAYGQNSGVMNEGTPLTAAGVKGRVRADMWRSAADATRAGTLAATEIRAGDYFGPMVVDSAFGARAIPNIIKGKTVRLLGRLDLPHSFSFIDDVVSAVCVGVRDPLAVGRPIIAPMITTTQRQMFSALARAASSTSTLSTIPWPIIRALGIVVPLMRELAETRYQWDEEFVADDSGTVRDFGLDVTDLDVAAKATIDWYRSRQ